MKIGVIGLGYVGLPLARLLATKYTTIGFDIDESRVAMLRQGKDTTQEIDEKNLTSVLLESFPIANDTGLFVSNNLTDLADCNFYILTVPTPVDKTNRPDLSPLLKASEMIGGLLKKGDIVVYESTVYPGATEEDCVPVLEKKSGLTFNKDFFVGYSPERINPGDKLRTVDKILKVTSGSNEQTAQIVDQIYGSVITAGTYLAPSIKVAEAAKVIENSQRDINIAFVNELSKIFNLMGISTKDVLNAASTKWNFHSFEPGLVGGHCIGVDPYYLAQKAQEYGYHPEVILAGRRINDSMGAYVASQVVKKMIQSDIKVKGADVLVLGFAFKENCTDVRNTKVIDVVSSLKEYSTKVDVYDPNVDAELVKEEYNIQMILTLPKKKYKAVILAVPHKELRELNFGDYLEDDGVLYDIKGSIESELVKGKL